MSWIRSRYFFDVLNGLLTFFVILLGTAIFIVQSRADERVEQSVQIHNAPPSVVTAVASTEPGGTGVNLFFLTTGKSTTLFVWGQVSDPNGCEDIRHIDVKVYRKDLGSDCQLQEGLCMEVKDIVPEGCVAGFDQATYVAAVPIPYYADPTDTGSVSEGLSWRGSATVTDASFAAASANTDDFQIASLTAMNAGDVINFGVLIPGATSDPIDLPLENQGNRPFDFSVYSMGDLACSSGASFSIPSSNVHVSETHESTFDQSAALVAPIKPVTNGAVSSPNFVEGLTQLFTEGISQDTVNPNRLAVPQPITLPLHVETRLAGSGVRSAFFFLRVPETVTSGACSGSLGITAQTRS